MQLYFDFDRLPAVPVAMPADVADCLRRSGREETRTRETRGRIAYCAGQLAEGSVADHYRRAGYQLIHTRWRGCAGEIDIIARKGQLYVFVEVKSSKSFARAAERISPRQIRRICMAASEFCGRLPTGQSTQMRMDAALVDQFGRVEVIENAFGAD